MDDMARDAEFRVQIPLPLMQQIDALCQAGGFKSRGDWFETIAGREVRREIHRATVLLRMCRVNPLAVDADAGAPE
jgi:metal-responsive CopG/Arc/MetJ family transcriptional regulator